MIQGTTVEVQHVGTFATKFKVAMIKEQLKKQELIKQSTVHTNNSDHKLYFY